MEEVDWVNAPVGAKKDVKLSDGTIIHFYKTEAHGWVNRELTKKERRQLNMAPKKDIGVSVPPVHTTTNYTHTNYTHWHDHDGLKLVYECRNGAKLFGANKYGLKQSRPDVVIDMAGNLKPNFIQNAPEKYHILKKYVSVPEPEVLNLDWEDYGTPPVSFRFWKTLLSLIAGQNVTLTCMGGHGRTGTAMAALMIADGLAPNRAMARVWSDYCEKAIETTSQENYLLALAGQSRAELNEPVTERSVTHSVHCRCTECLGSAVARLDAAYAAQQNDSSEEDAEAWERYQTWARNHGVGKQPMLPNGNEEAYNW